MLYVNVDDSDGFMCDGEWVSRTNSHPIDHQFEALQEWQEQLDEVADVTASSHVPLDGLQHGGGRKATPPPGGGTWRYRRRG